MRRTGQCALSCGCVAPEAPAQGRDRHGAARWQGGRHHRRRLRRGTRQRGAVRAARRARRVRRPPRRMGEGDGAPGRGRVGYGGCGDVRCRAPGRGRGRGPDCGRRIRPARRDVQQRRNRVAPSGHPPGGAHRRRLRPFRRRERARCVQWVPNRGPAVQGAGWRWGRGQHRVGGRDGVVGERRRTAGRRPW